MEFEPAAAPRIDFGKLPTFNGFPYLATRLASAVYHIRILPAAWSCDAQWAFALRQAGANGLPVCLARDAERGEYFDPETGGTQIAGTPRAGILPPGELVVVEAIQESAELRGRAEALETYRRERVTHFGGAAALTHPRFPGSEAHVGAPRGARFTPWSRFGSVRHSPAQHAYILRKTHLRFGRCQCASRQYSLVSEATGYLRTIAEPPPQEYPCTRNPRSASTREGGLRDSPRSLPYRRLTPSMRLPIASITLNL